MLAGGHQLMVTAERNVRSSPSMTRIWPVTVNVAVERISPELLPVLSSTGPGFHDDFTGTVGVSQDTQRTANWTVLDFPGRPPVSETVTEARTWSPTSTVPLSNRSGPYPNVV